MSASKSKRKTAAALKRIRLARPRPTVKAFRAIGFTLRRIGAGAYRTVYQLDTLPLVVKIPKGGSGVEHNHLEVKRIARLRGGLFDKNLPKIEYFDKKQGTLVMRFYEIRTTYQTADLLGKLMSRLTGMTFTDIKESNMRVGNDGRVKFVDLAF